MAPNCGEVTLDKMASINEDLSDASIRPQFQFWRVEGSERSPMEELAEWIVGLRRKKLRCHSNRKRNLRVEAMLTHTLRNAEYEYRAKQLMRLSCWRRLKKHLLKDVEYGSCGLYNATGREVEYQQLVSKQNNLWQESMCEDLSSLDSFLQQLARVKFTSQR